VASGAAIELTGGLPSQIVHFYYIPVVLAALLLPIRLSLAVAILAGLAVSPVNDFARAPMGLDPYFDNPAPWNLDPTGWVVRPLAFMAISLVAGRITHETSAKVAAMTRSAAHHGELTVLASIDKMILGGATEEDALREIASLVRQATGAANAGIVLRSETPGRMRVVHGPDASPEVVAATADGLPFGEGVSGWALMHGKLAVSGNVFDDPRYDEMKDIARRTGSRAAAAAPVILDGEVLAAIAITHDQDQAFAPEELATLQRIADQAAIAVASARQRESLRTLAQGTAIGLAEAIESRDPYTGDHCTRLAHYAAAMAHALELSRKEIDAIQLGAALHDVGKVVVPDAILKKPDVLTPDEFAVIKQHCYSGGQICKRIPFLKAAYPIVYHHHERYDGRGYPDGIAGERIPLGARIVSVADAYDAMTSDRPYRKALSIEHARTVLREGAGKEWDPAIVEAFLALEPDVVLQAA
jgi:putative nucleotidyltransferase with HDIG domain